MAHGISLVARANKIQSFRCKPLPPSLSLRPLHGPGNLKAERQVTSSRTFYANVCWPRRPGTWPGPVRKLWRILNTAAVTFHFALNLKFKSRREFLVSKTFKALKLPQIAPMSPSTPCHSSLGPARPGAGTRKSRDIYMECSDAACVPVNVRWPPDPWQRAVALLY